MSNGLHLFHSSKGYMKKMFSKIYDSRYGARSLTPGGRYTAVLKVRGSSQQLLFRHQRHPPWSSGLIQTPPSSEPSTNNRLPSRQLTEHVGESMPTQVHCYVRRKPGKHHDHETAVLANFAIPRVAGRKSSLTTSLASEIATRGIALCIETDRDKTLPSRCGVNSQLCLLDPNACGWNPRKAAASDPMTYVMSQPSY